MVNPLFAIIHLVALVISPLLLFVTIPLNWLAAVIEGNAYRAKLARLTDDAQAVNPAHDTAASNDGSLRDQQQTLEQRLHKSEKIQRILAWSTGVVLLLSAFIVLTNL